MNYAFYSNAIVGKREQQQDYIQSSPIPQFNADLHLLADGMGGHVGGEIASKTICSVFLDVVRKTSQLESYPQLLRHAADEANKALRYKITNNPELSGMGSTLIAVLYLKDNNSFYYISVGDSPLYLLRNQQLQRINQNHAYYEELQEQVKAGLITQQQADTDPNRNAITSALMGDRMSLIDCPEYAFELHPGDLIMLASDGVQTLNDQANGEIEKLINKKDNIENKINNVLKAVNQKNDSYQDNCSLIIFGDDSSNQQMAKPIRQMRETSHKPKSPTLIIQPKTKKPKMALLILLPIVIATASTFFILNKNDTFKDFFTASDKKLTTEKEQPSLKATESIAGQTSEAVKAKTPVKKEPQPNIDKDVTKDTPQSASNLPSTIKQEENKQPILNPTAPKTGQTSEAVKAKTPVNKKPQPSIDKYAPNNDSQSAPIPIKQKDNQNVNNKYPENNQRFRRPEQIYQQNRRQYPPHPRPRYNEPRSRNRDPRYWQRQ